MRSLAAVGWPPHDEEALGVRVDILVLPERNGDGIHAFVVRAFTEKGNRLLVADPVADEVSETLVGASERVLVSLEAALSRGHGSNVPRRRLPKTAPWARQNSNLGPTDYEGGH
jgi:hypothetical protein